MCIAIVKPMGTALPSKEVLQRCWDNNPDGAGFMYNNGENVIIHKGFTKFKGFYKFLMAINSKEDLEDKDVVLHFRIATSGGVSREATHPFPITKDLDEMRKLDNVCEYGFAHNGIIQGYGSKDFSDTMEYIKDIISNIKNIEENEDLLDALANAHSSRFAVLTKDNFELGGNWVVDNGVYYSNTSYKEYYYYYNLKNAKEDEVELCDCCDQYVYKDDIIKTGYGNICVWCYDELYDKKYSWLSEPEEPKELVFD